MAVFLVQDFEGQTAACFPSGFLFNDQCNLFRSAANLGICRADWIQGEIWGFGGRIGFKVKFDLLNPFVVAVGRDLTAKIMRVLLLDPQPLPRNWI